ncbi:hypothetical protein D3C81_1705580 [compost metagenome]
MALCWATCFLMVYISIAAVTAAYGFALTASPFWQTPQKEPKGLAPPFGPSLRLGVPSLRHCSVGPPRSAIHGRARLSRHPCRDAHCATPAFGLWKRGGWIKIKSQARSKDRSLRQLLQGNVHELPTRPAGRPPRVLLILLPPREAEWRFCAVGNPAWMPG